MTGVLPFLVTFTVLHHPSAMILNDMYGTFHSPNFPESYPKDSEVRWNISVPSGYKIRLYFMHFDLEPSYLCEYDYVKLEAEEEVLATFCGRENTDTELVPGEQVISSPRNTLVVTFRSDFSDEERFFGFKAHYSAVDVDECQDRNDEELTCDHYCHNYIGGYYCSCRYGYLLHYDNRTCKVECTDDLFSEPTGVLSSVNFPNPYPKSTDCTYHIKLEDGFLINLEFDDTFDIEDHPEITCPYDYIKIQTGQKELGPFCGDKPPDRIQTASNHVQVFFHSDSSGENIGWRLSYTADGNNCPVLNPPVHGHLEPFLPHYSFKNHILITCDPGYKVLKDGTEIDHYEIECQKDGTWSSSVLTCKMVDCESPREISMGVVMFETSRNSTLFGSRIYYTCKDPLYQIHPRINSTYICGETGEWTNKEIGTKLPSCLPACGKPEQALPSVLKRIVGGHIASPGQFPWQVLLLVEDATRVPEDRWFGSGALISDLWVLTAAHVLRLQRRDASVVPVAPEHVQVYMGLHHIQSKHLALNRSIDKLVLHPYFDPRNYNNDIALVKMSQRVPMNALVLPVCLPLRDQSRSELLPSMLGLVAGWGISNLNTSIDSMVTSDTGVVTDMLQYVKLPVVAKEECQSSYASRSGKYNITDNMFCAGFFEGGRDTCLGDSGGAFVMVDPDTGRWVAQGLVSWGGPEECGSQRVYGVYTKLSNYVEWLQSHLNLGSWW
ncbi:mannan-binding lectin serine protease 1 [Paramormyrops kingsleyae]|uniref:MBL associated serine protease 1 n=1 Tax=Paramormyrops kingsleyae TaxID=1676925 RepID=A0A3B3S993_9TELE|nr:mannan-binding lectin serine protease 1 [Paramormyrops kingsleyae]XP_023665398.1 mannan-binding lectin serine protease 1 [Paramormyrops kingsleyae]